MGESYQYNVLVVPTGVTTLPFSRLQLRTYQATDAELLNLNVSFTCSVTARLYLLKETDMHLELFDQNVFEH